MFSLTIVIVIQYYPEISRACGEFAASRIFGFPKDNTTIVVGDTKGTPRILILAGKGN